MSSSRRIRNNVSIEGIDYIQSGYNLEIHNLNGTGNRKPPFGGSWIIFYRIRTGQPRAVLKCSKLYCSNNAKDGGHIQKQGKDTENTWYIVPLCGKCNHPKNEKVFELKANTKMAFVVV